MNAQAHVVRTPGPVEDLSAEESLHLLASQSLGRLAISRPDAAPHVVPVNFTLLRGSIVFRTIPGTKLTLLVTEPVTFEADSWDPDRRTGWSVVVEGLAYAASDREMEIEEIQLDSLAEQQTSRWARIVPRTITGRRIAAMPVEEMPPVLIPDPALETWHGGERDRLPF